MEEKRFCLQCDENHVLSFLEYGARDLSFTRNGRTHTVPQVFGWHCPVCGDCHFDAGEGERYGEAMDAFSAQVDAEIAAALRATRKKLGLRQVEAGHLFGGGSSAFSEYERGKTQPHKSTVLLFKLLDKHPELLNEIRAA
ncbi:MAG: type II toxin-antitoxin system MqsA family antitoxin [Rhodoferax sp.]|nr:type II toxin-antitoxin system MqsA family antitoxin [Rhodoferax sp.]